MSHIESGHHGNLVEAHDVAAIADLAHFPVQEFRGVEQGRALFRRTSNLVLLLQDSHADSDRSVRHAVCSMACNRPIMASTRARTCSCLLSKLARSVIRVSCRWRSARFSSLRSVTLLTSSSMRFSSDLSSTAATDLEDESLMT